MKRERKENEADGRTTRVASHDEWRVSARSSSDGEVLHGHDVNVVMEYESSEWTF